MACSVPFRRNHFSTPPRCFRFSWQTTPITPTAFGFTSAVRPMPPFAPRTVWRRSTPPSRAFRHRIASHRTRPSSSWKVCAADSASSALTAMSTGRCRYHLHLEHPPLPAPGNRNRPPPPNAGQHRGHLTEPKKAVRRAPVPDGSLWDIMEFAQETPSHSRNRAIVLIKQALHRRILSKTPV